MTQTAAQYWEEAQYSYDGVIPEDVKETYETMKAIEEGKPTPAQKRTEQQIRHLMDRAMYTIDSASGHLRLGNKEYAAMLLKDAAHQATYLAEMLNA